LLARPLTRAVPNRYGLRMTLRDWLTEQGITRAEFAARVGVSEVQITRVINRNRGASLRLAVAIERETGGRVRPGDLVKQSA